MTLFQKGRYGTSTCVNTVLYNESQEILKREREKYQRNLVTSDTLYNPSSIFNFPCITASYDENKCFLYKCVKCKNPKDKIVHEWLKEYKFSTIEHSVSSMICNKFGPHSPIDFIVDGSIAIEIFDTCQHSKGNCEEVCPKQQKRLGAECFHTDLKLKIETRTDMQNQHMIVLASSMIRKNSVKIKEEMIKAIAYIKNLHSSQSIVVAIDSKKDKHFDFLFLDHIFTSASVYNHPILERRNI